MRIRFTRRVAVIVALLAIAVAGIVAGSASAGATVKSPDRHCTYVGPHCPKVGVGDGNGHGGGDWWWY